MVQPKAQISFRNFRHVFREMWRSKEIGPPCCDFRFARSSIHNDSSDTFVLTAGRIGRARALMVRCVALLFAVLDS